MAAQVVRHGRRPDLDKLEHRRYAGLTAGRLRRYKGLMEKCWKQEPRERPKMEEVHKELSLIKEGGPRRGAGQ